MKAYGPQIRRYCDEYAPQSSIAKVRSNKRHDLRRRMAKSGRQEAASEIEYQLRDHWEGLIDDQLEQPDYWDDWPEVIDPDECRRIFAMLDLD